MEVKDLMICDWVMSKKSQLHFQVKRISTKWVMDKDGCYSNFVDIKPIPLTPEILEKNGFEKVLDEDGTECYRYYNSAADGYIKVSLYYGGDGDWSIEIINYEKFDDNKIVYNNNFIFLKVHQFQHVLKVCGIDKEIEL